MMPAAWQARWTALSVRERAMVAGAAAVVVLALLYALGIEPAWRERRRLLAALPELEAQRVEVLALAEQARRATTATGGRDPSRSLPAVVTTSLGRAGLQAQVAEEAGQISVRARRVPATALFPWLEALSREARLRVASARITRAGPAGTVDADIVLSRTER